MLRVGFCLLQAIDDLLDGDRPSVADPRLIAESIATQLQTGEFRTDHLGTMAEVLKEELDAVRTGSDDPVGEAIALIRHMTVDRERVEQSLIFDAEQLRSHHRTTFMHSLNLLLIAAGATTRASDVPELVEAFGWCSTVRDLEEDLGHGLARLAVGRHRHDVHVRMGGNQADQFRAGIAAGPQDRDSRHRPSPQIPCAGQAGAVTRLPSRT